MKQSRLMSMLESIINITVGFGIGLGAQLLFLPMLGVQVSLSQNLVFALIMTGISIVRSYLLRRMFEALQIRRPLSPFMQAVIAERYRQIEVEGWDATHDDGSHSTGSLSAAGAAYALGEEVHRCERWQDGSFVEVTGRLLWPWDIDWWKPQGFRRNQVKAAALIIAEGERFDRARKALR